MGLPSAPSQGTVTGACAAAEQWGLDTLLSCTLCELRPTCQESENQGSGLSLAGVSGSGQEGTFLRS